MSCKNALAALSLIIAGSGTSAGAHPNMTTPAPAGSPGARYCLRVDPITGSRIETIQCRTRQDWTELGIDVDVEWAENGVRVIG
jgi:hypothetical protein